MRITITIHDGQEIPDFSDPPIPPIPPIHPREDPVLNPQSVLDAFLERDDWTQGMSKQQISIIRDRLSREWTPNQSQIEKAFFTTAWIVEQVRRHTISTSSDESTTHSISGLLIPVKQVETVQEFLRRAGFRTEWGEGEQPTHKSLTVSWGPGKKGPRKG